MTTLTEDIGTLKTDFRDGRLRAVRVYAVEGCATREEAEDFPALPALGEPYPHPKLMWLVAGHPIAKLAGAGRWEVEVEYREAAK